MFSTVYKGMDWSLLQKVLFVNQNILKYPTYAKDFAAIRFKNYCGIIHIILLPHILEICSQMFNPKVVKIFTNLGYEDHICYKGSD